MAAPAQQVQTKPLRRSTDPSEYDVYRAGLEWGLVDPIIIHDRKDLKSEVRWHDRVEPFHHQVTNLITYCRRLPVTLLADDVGLGKTISAGLIASELIARRRLSRILIVAPKLLGPQWKEELSAKFNIPAVVAAGQELLDAEPEGEVGAVITTYHSAREYIKRLPADRFQMLILDEAHKLRNLYGVPKPPKVAERFREVLANRAFKFVLMLTATPIQNRLWDLYSLVDLLTVARGHQNPFGSEGMFARNFIADGRSTARQLKPEAKDQFRSIVYGYMSRVRRADAQLHFPTRKVFRQGVPPTEEEKELIRLIAKPIQKLNRLAQIGILQALTSSPDACALQLENMARKGTFPADIAQKFRTVVKGMKMSAKLQGVAALVAQLKKENPQNWRMVVFTQRRETQTTIQAYLEGLGVSVGLINGETTGRNQTTIGNFKASPPKINVIVSTEAGSEGVNLQAANVLVNYDLPWNPMIVEQRIGRVQRLGSEHANVLVYSVTLAGTFEDYIVGRLLQKLQMASHAIGDIESLLEASGMGDGDEDGATSFEDEILRLVLDSLAGKDVNAATRAAEDSIERAQQTLVDEEKNIDEMLGAMDGAAYKGPRSPDLPPQTRSMTARGFVLSALRALGAKLAEQPPDKYGCEFEGRRETICFNEDPNPDSRSVLYRPGSQAFDRLISRVTQSGVYDVEDADTDPQRGAQVMAAEWVQSFGGSLRTAKLARVTRIYSGEALLQVRATTAHDSYERLIPIKCTEEEHQTDDRNGLDPIPPVIDRPQDIGLSLDRITRSAILDPGIAEFCRFYSERRAEEVRAAGDDTRMRKKLDDDFTPRLQTTIAGLRGTARRILEGQVTYTIDHAEYTSTLKLVPSTSQIVDAPPFASCAKTTRKVPIDTLSECAVSGAKVMRHLLVKSAVSDRFALPEHTVVCSLNGQRVLSSEVETSDVSGQPVLRRLLKTSSLSGRKAEPQHVGRCAFTQTDALLSELATSEVSGKPFRSDQAQKSDVSAKTGHASEFITCPVTGRTLLPVEAERCAVTGQVVFPGMLEECAVSKQRVVPQLLSPSSVSGRCALQQYLVVSSISGVRCLQEEAIRSDAGRFCTRAEAKTCAWTNRETHPDDLRICDLTGLAIHYCIATRQPPYRLSPLAEMLGGTRRAADEKPLWHDLAQLASDVSEGRCTIESVQASPDGKQLAVCSEQRKLLGFRTRYIGFVYSIADRAIIGRLAVGKRSNLAWVDAA